MAATPILMTIAVLGGTGKEGKGLATRWAKAGYHIVIGSRTIEKAKAVADEMMKSLDGKAIVEGTTNHEAARVGDIVVLAIPYNAHRSTLEDVKDALLGKMLIDVTVPLVPPKITRAQMPPEGSAAQEAMKILGENCQVASAFQTISYERLLSEDDIESEVLVTGTSKEAREETLKLVAAAGLKGWDAGVIENSAVVEGLTSVLLHINRQYGSRKAGIKITGI